MSVSISYFFDSDKPITSLIAEINDVIGCSLAISLEAPESASSAPQFFGMELTFHKGINNEKEGYSDDNDLKFSQYNYEFDLTTYWGQADVRSVQLPTILSAIYILHRRLGIVGMLVCDVQILLAKYEEKQLEENLSALYDVVSETTFIEFADHLSVIQKRLPNRWSQDN